MPRLKALNAYWAKHPPVHLMVAAYLGFKPADGKPSEDTAKQLDAMVGQAPTVRGAPKLDNSAWNNRGKPDG